MQPYRRSIAVASFVLLLSLVAHPPETGLVAAHEPSAKARTVQEEQGPQDIGGILFSSCDETNSTDCARRCAGLHGTDSYLSDKCCIHSGKSASILAFEEDDKWVPRLQEFNDCTGATVRLEYLPEGEDGMEEAIRRDVGDGTWPGEGIFDAYIVQAPW
jgi:hypothetical protein